MAGTGNSTPQAGDAGVIPVPQAGETPEASVYRPLQQAEESDIQNVSASVGMLPSLIYSDPSDFIRQRQSSVESLPQQQGGITPEWLGKGNIAASEMEQAWYVPQVGSSQEMSGQQPQIGHKSLAIGLVDQPAQESSDEEEDDRSKLTLSVQLKLVLNHFPAVTKESMQKCLQLYIVKHMQMLVNMGQRVPEEDLTEYIELYTRIFELELKEYMKCKEARATARSTATPAESVDYDAIRCQ
ncbi:hypothetical protein C0995_009851 [Termitomyces sp. Mi166|nr:hypothetical protein C0995_009851 [Termitomyces sp. Mi166\